MNDDKKIWFVGHSSRFWVPCSVEGWAVTAAFFAGFALIGALNNVPAPSGGRIAALVAQYVALFAVCYFITKGHVDKRY